MAGDFLLGVSIVAYDYFTGPLKSMMSSITAAQGKFAGLTNTMKLMGKSKSEIDAINQSLNRMADQKAFANVASDLEKIGTARQDIAAMESSYMQMAQYQRDMAAAQEKYAAGKDLAMSGVGDVAMAGVGAFGIFELVKKAGEFQSTMTVIQDITGASTKQMNTFSDAVMNASAQVSKFNDMQMSQIAQGLTSGGFGNIKDVQNLLLPAAKYAEVQMYEKKGTDPAAITRQAAEMAHAFKIYDPNQFESFLNTFNKYSMMQPGDSTQLAETLKYLAPTANQMHMKQSDVMALAAIDNRIGLTGSHGGTNSADMIMRLIPGLVGGGPTKKGTPKAWAAMEQLGFVDKNGKSPFFDSKGNLTDLNGMLGTMISDSKKFNPMQLTGLYKDIFGIQGGRAASALSNPGTLEQLKKMQQQLGKTKSMEQMNKNLQNGPEGQLNKAASNSMTLMLRVGKQLAVTLTPAIQKVNDLLDSMLKFSTAHPGINKLIGDFALFAVGGKMTEGVLKIVAGNFKMLGGAIDMIKPSTMIGNLAKIKTGFSNLKKELNLVKTGVGKMVNVFKFTKASGEMTRFGKIATGTWSGLKKGADILNNAVSKGVMKLGSSLKTLGSVGKSAFKWLGSATLKGIQAMGTGLKALGSGSLTVIKALGRFGLALGKLGLQAAKWAIQMAADWLIAMGPVGWIIAGVTALVAAGIIAWKTNFLGFQDKLKAVWKVVQTDAGAAWKWVQDRANDFMNFLKGLPGQAMQIGKNIIDGLKNGLSNAVGGLLNTVKGIGSSISGAFKSILGIHSPSKVFMEHGKYIVQGLSMGIDQNARMATKSTVDLAKGVNNSFNPNPKGTLSLAKNQSGGQQYTDNSQIIFQPGSVVVNAQPGQDAKSLARDTMNELGKLLRKQGYRTGQKPVNAW